MSQSEHDIVVEGCVRLTNNSGIPDVAISNSLDSSVTQSDANSHYKPVTQTANEPTNFGNPGLRPFSVMISDLRLRVRYLTLIRQVHNDFSNRVHITTLNSSEEASSLSKFAIVDNSLTEETKSNS